VTGRTHLLGRSAFLVLGWSGFGLAVVLVMALSAATGLSLAVQAAISLAAVGVYVAVAWAARRWLGRPVLIYYHHVLAFLACTAAIAAILGAPVLEHLDVTACGLAAFTAVARVGCLMVGCCHGRPARWGVTYRPAHMTLGLPGYLVAVPLLPVQAFESAACAGIAIGGSAAVLAGAAPGTALILFAAGYALLRFPLEWLRGDLLRPYRRRLSEAQWTSLAVALAVAAGALAGVVPGGAAAAVPAAVLAVAALLTAAGHAPGAQALLAPPHVAELAARLDRLGASGPGRVERTSAGLWVSAGRTAGRTHYTVSADKGPLAPGEAREVARVLVWMRHPQIGAEIVAGQANAFHVLIE
jgi:hypothetical protein